MRRRAATDPDRAAPPAHMLRFQNDRALNMSRLVVVRQARMFCQRRQQARGEGSRWGAHGNVQKLRPAYLGGARHAHKLEQIHGQRKLGKPVGTTRDGAWESVVRQRYRRSRASVWAASADLVLSCGLLRTGVARR